MLLEWSAKVFYAVCCKSVLGVQWSELLLVKFETCRSPLTFVYTLWAVCFIPNLSALAKPEEVGDTIVYLLRKFFICVFYLCK